jgi:hypothetical protein
MAKRKTAEPSPGSEVVYRIHTLLHTIRAISRHEDSLCALMNEIKTGGVVTEALDTELRDLLEEMPAHEYFEDVDAVRQALRPASSTTS